MDAVDNFLPISLFGVCCLGLLIAIGLFIVLLIISKLQKKNFKNKIENELREKNILITRRVDLVDRYSFIVDSAGEKVVCCNFKNGNFKIFGFSDLVRCEIARDEEIARTGSSVNTVVGGVVGGAAGAIIMDSFRKNITEVKKLNVVIITKTIDTPAYTFELVRKKTATSSVTYKKYMKFAEEVFVTVESIIAHRTT